MIEDMESEAPDNSFEADYSSDDGLGSVGVEDGTYNQERPEDVQNPKLEQGVESSSPGTAKHDIPSTSSENVSDGEVPVLAFYICDI